MSFYCSLSNDNSFCLLRNLIMAKLFHSWHLMLLNALKLNNRKQLWGEISFLIHVAKGGKCNSFLLHNWDCSKGDCSTKMWSPLWLVDFKENSKKRLHSYNSTLLSCLVRLHLLRPKLLHAVEEKEKKESVLETYISHYMKLSRTFSCFNKQNSRTTIGQNIQVTTLIVT